MSDAIGAIGLQICIYYCFAAFAAVALFRKYIFKSVKNFIFMGLWPLIGGVFMAVIFVKVLPTLNGVTKSVGLGSIALGLIPMIWYWSRGHAYFKLPTKDERLAVAREIEMNL